MPFTQLGYEVAHVGFKQWNGVAIASRVGLDDVQIGFAGKPAWGEADAAVAEARALGATCGGVRVWSLYVPNGRTLADPHYTYKLDWLAALRDRRRAGCATIPRRRSRWSATGTSPRTDEDVWDIDVLRGEHARLRAGARGVPRLRRGAVRRRRAAVHAGPGRLHLLGLHPAALPEAAGHAHRLRARHRPRWPARVTDAQIDREERKGKGAERPRARAD